CFEAPGASLSLVTTALKAKIREANSMMSHSDESAVSMEATEQSPQSPLCAIAARRPTPTRRESRAVAAKKGGRRRSKTMKALDAPATLGGYPTAHLNELTASLWDERCGLIRELRLLARERRRLVGLLPWWAAPGPT